MEAERRRGAKRQLIALMQAGHSWQEAATVAGMQISRSGAYRLLQKVRKRGEAALLDGRHGHPTKLRELVREFLETTCRETPFHTESRGASRAPRAVWHLRQYWSPQSGPCPDRRRKPSRSPGKKPQIPCSSEEAHWQEGAGGLLLLTAAETTGWGGGALASRGMSA